MSNPPETLTDPRHAQGDRLAMAFDFEREAEAEGSEDAEASEEVEVSETPAEEGDGSRVEITPEDLAEQEKAEAEEAEAEPEETEAEPAETAEDELEISHVKDLGEAFGMEPDEILKHLQVDVGEESFPLSEVIERASQQPLPAQMAQMVGEQATAIQAAEAQRQQAHEEHETFFLGAVNAIISRAEREAGFGDEALAQLRIQDPEGWAVKSEEKRQFYAMIDAGVKAAREHGANRKQQSSEAYQARAVEEGLKLIQAVPQWQDQDTAIREATEISEWVQGRYNFTAEEMGDMPDHRLALIFRDNFILSQQAAKSEETKKTLTKKKMTVRRSVLPTRPRRAKGDPRQIARAAAKQLQRETIGRPDRAKEHGEAAAERLGDFL